MRTLFETFSTELQPFAADLSVTLVRRRAWLPQLIVQRDSYLRILTESRDARGGDAAEDAANEEKTLSCELPAQWTALTRQPWAFSRRSRS